MADEGEELVAALREVQLVRKDGKYVGLVVIKDGMHHFGWLVPPIESTVSLRGRRNYNFLPPQDASLIRGLVRGGTFLVSNEQKHHAPSDLQADVPAICWHKAHWFASISIFFGLAFYCVYKTFALSLQPSSLRYVS